MEEELRLRYGVPVRPVISTPRSINQAIAQYYAPGMRDDAVSQAADVSSGKKAKKDKSSKKAKVSTGKSYEQLSESEQQNRNNIGKLMICWSIILPMLPLILGSVGSIKMMILEYSFLTKIPWLVLITGPVTIWWVTQKYWK